MKKKLTKKELRKRFPGIRFDVPTLWYRGGGAYGGKYGPGAVRCVFPDGIVTILLLNECWLSVRKDHLAPRRGNLACWWAVIPWPNRPKSSTEAIEELLAYDKREESETYFAGNLCE